MTAANFVCSGPPAVLKILFSYITLNAKVESTPVCARALGGVALWGFGERESLDEKHTSMSIALANR